MQLGFSLKDVVTYETTDKKNQNWRAEKFPAHQYCKIKQICFGENAKDDV